MLPTGSWRSRRSGFRELQRSGDRKKIAPQTLWSQPRCFLSCLGSLWLRGTVHLLLCADSLRLCCWDCITCNPSSQGTLTAKRRQESEKSRPQEPLPFAGCFGSTVLPGFRAVTGLQGNTLSAFFSFDSRSFPTPDYLCPSSSQI
uniref:Uncharacterized protein n=1 Tax=Mus musculus TaxID=10090 RepID=Q3UMJ3_MOUSE|nr:unnamed protein product [Mus musculus]